MPSPHNFIIFDDFFPDKYSKFLFAQQMQPLFLFILVFDSSFFQTSKNSRFFSGLPFFNNIFIASLAWIDGIKPVIVFNTPAVSQVSSAAASLRKHLKQAVLSGMTLKT